MFTKEVLQKILLLGSGGFLGSNARFWLGTWIQEKWGGAFPLGTFIVNISGSFILGLFISLLSARLLVSQAPDLRLLFAVGFIGAYTTFSTYEYETLALYQSGSLGLAALNAFGSLAVGFVAVWIGMRLG